MVEGLRDPLAAVRAVSHLDQQLSKGGFTPALSTNFDDFSQRRRRLREGEPEGALFDIEASGIASSRAFWMSLAARDGRTVALQAFRADHADPTLADWMLGWILGTYLKRSELILPETIRVPEDSAARRFRGTVVYHGELWIERAVQGQHLLEPFARLGILLSYLRWRPKAIWALTDRKMAMFAKMERWGYVHQERAFLRWKFVPEYAARSEWLWIADRSGIERLIRELALKRPEYRRE